MEEYNYTVISPDGETKFNKKQLKLIDNLLGKFSYQTELEVTYSKNCMSKLHDFLKKYSNMSKATKIKLNNTSVLFGNSDADIELYNWLMDWLDSVELIIELTEFMDEYNTDLYVNIIAVKYMNDMEKLTPIEFAQKYSYNQNLDESEIEIVDNYTDWLSDF